MAVLSELIQLVDNGVDPGFAASLAGLSLAAAAFFAPSADKTLRDADDQINKLEKSIERGETHGFVEQTENKKELGTLKGVVESTKSAQQGLIKAFLIFVWFVAYTISIDSLINDVTAQSLDGLLLGMFGAATYQTIDVIISVSLLSYAGKHLWVGANGIAEYFDVNFKDEKERAEKLLIETVKKIEELKEKT